MKTVKKTHWFRNTCLIIACCMILGLILSFVLYAKDHNRTYAAAKLTFSFDGAQDGIAPNGYAFDINEIDNELIVEDALENAGLAGRYEAAEILSNLVAQGEYPEDLVSQVTKYNSVLSASSSQTYTLSEYHPTVYSVILYNDFDPQIASSDLSSLLENILLSYKTWFKIHYSIGTIDGVDEEKLANYDYFQQIDILESKLDQAIDFSTEMADKDETMQVGGKSFGDMIALFTSMQSNDVSRLNAIMTMNALSKDMDRLQNQYKMRIQDLQTQVTVQTRLLENMDLLISTYGKTGIIYLSTAETLNKVDRLSPEIYDQLVDMRSEISDNIAVLNLQIANYQNSLKQLRTGKIQNAVQENISDSENDEVTAAEIEEALIEDEEELTELLSEADTETKKEILEIEISRLLNNINTNIALLEEMTENYNHQEINDYSVSQSSVSYKAPSVVSGSFIVLAVKTVGPICALGFMLALVLIIVSRRKAMKEA